MNLRTVFEPSLADRSFGDHLVAVNLVTAHLIQLFRRGEFSDGFRAFADGVLGQLPGKQKSDGGLDFSTGQSLTLIFPGQRGSFRRQSAKQVADERVHDAHRLGGDAGVGMHLLQHFVDVGREGFFALSASSTTGFRRGRGGD